MDGIEAIRTVAAGESPFAGEIAEAHLTPGFTA
jgi:hypothetical protein